eukprot:2684577-Amphidinium_carterae.1
MDWQQEGAATGEYTQPPKPKPDLLRVAAANINSLPQNFDAVLQLCEDSCDIVCLSEHSVAKGDVPAVKKKLAASGWASIITPAPPNKAGKPQGGTAILARKPFELAETWHDVTENSRTSGRLTTAWILVSGKPLAHLAAVYGPTAPTATKNLEEADDFWQSVASWVNIHHKQRMLIAGDFNLIPGENDHADSMLHYGQMQRSLDRSL